MIKLTIRHIDEVMSTDNATEFYKELRAVLSLNDPLINVHLDNVRLERDLSQKRLTIELSEEQDVVRIFEMVPAIAPRIKM